MAGSTSEDYGAGGRSSSAEGMSSGQQCQSGDSIAEWRSCEQVENGIPSTSPPYWDTDDDDDCGAKPSELYGKFTWKIENFSQISKRELRSNAFEVGGYKWYILIYPQGCDVCNHLSLFLCVANHDKLLPGWSHFAQFTIAVVNKDPKKSKYSDTLHRFWKKEHDWGWKKFMELSKVLDGFIVDPDTLVIKAQVQVIREKAHRPFRCLDCQYRRELVRVYLANVEQICRRFVEERRGKLGKLIEDKVRWSSFRAFWLGIDQNTKRHMSRDKTDAILKVVVKHFFIEKEVTSTLVMDSLYSGLKALECENENKRGSAKLVEMEESPAPMVRVEKDMFVLADDVLRLLERAALEPLPHQPLTPKDDKGSQNRTKDGSGEEFNKDSIERDERRLTELGRRTVEIFVVAHIFSSRIEVSYQEAVALKRQEELIREEEAAGQAENDLRTKRGAAEKEKRTKKKQAKQRRSGRKGKDRVREEKFSAMIEGKHQEDSPPDERILETSKQAQSVLEKIEIMEDVSDVSGTGDDVTETIQPDLDDRDTSPINWDTDTSEIHPAMEASSSEIPNGQNERKNQTLMDDSSSTCSTDSVPSVVMNGPSKGNSLPNNKSQTLPSRGRNRRSKDTRDRAHGGKSMPSDTFADTVRLHDVPSSCRATGPESEAVLRDVSGSCRPTGPESEADLRDVSGSCRATEPESEAVLSLKDQIQRLEQNLVEKEEEVVSLQKKLSIKDQVDVDRPSKARAAEKSCSSTSPGKKPPSILQQSKQSSENTTTTTTTTGEPVSTRESSSNSPIPTEKSVSLATRGPQIPSISKSEVPKQTTPSKSTTTHQVSAMSRPSSAPLIPGPRPTAPIVSTVQTAPLLSRSVSAAGRLGTEPSPSAQSYVPQSYRNAIMGKTSMGTSPVGLPTRPSVNSSSQAVSHSLSSSAFVSSNVLPPQTTARKDLGSVRPGFTFGSVTQETLYRRHQWVDDNSRQETSSSGRPYDSNLVNDFSRLGIHGESRAKFYSGDVPFNGISSRQVQGMTADEFPHLDIINDLLDDEQNLVGRAYNGHQHHALNRQYTFPGDMVTADMGSSNDCCHFDQSEQYYDERLQRFYGTSSGPFNVMGSAHSPQIERSPYTLQNQWPFTGADLPMQNLGNTDANLYSYQLPDYSNLTDGVNRYAMYAPTKRH